jgi:hypothetical protein
MKRKLPAPHLTTEEDRRKRARPKHFANPTFSKKGVFLLSDVLCF